MAAKKELLDKLLKLTGGMYISDLRESYMREVIVDKIDNVENGVYSDNEWQNAFSYVTGNIIRSGTEHEIRELFKNM